MQTKIRNAEKNYSDEAVEKLRSFVEKHNESKSWDDGYYIIDTTGRYEVYFTLYRYTKVPPQIMGLINPYKYIKNLTSDLEKLNDVIAKLSRVPIPILLASYDNNEPKVCMFRDRVKEGTPVIKFGKYEGKTISEIWDEDRNWVMWFSKSYKVGTYTLRGREYQYKWDDNLIKLKENAKELIDIFFEELTEKNRQTCTSNYMGELKKRMFVEAKVLSIKHNAEYDYTTVNLEADNGDMCFIYDKEYGLNVGDKIGFKGTPTKHFERLGKKTTYFNRADIQTLNGEKY